MNEEINVPEVRLIDEDGTQLGVVGIADARDRAEKAELDLVEIAPGAEPPVCRIMDYGKFKYQQAKKVADQKKKKTQGGEMKQIRIKTFRIDPHDLQIKLKQSRKFIEENNRLLVTLMFRAREHSHSDLGRDLLVDQFAKALDDVAKVDSPPMKQGRRMTMLLSPVPNLKKVLADRKKAAKDPHKAAGKTEKEELPEEPREIEYVELPDDDDDYDDDFDDEE